MKTYTDTDIPWNGDKAVLTLARGERAWNPACTTCHVYGPATLEYRRFPDGGVNCAVIYPEPKKAPSRR